MPAYDPARRAPVTGHRWESALRGLRAEALDCVQTTVALLADHVHGVGAHLALGTDWRFPTPHDAAAASLRPPLSARLAQAARLGLSAVPSGSQATSGDVCERAKTGEPVFLVADAYVLPWVPYTGHRHMAHSFLLASRPGGHLVVDAYHNDTEWGPARPGAWALTDGELDAVLADGATVVTIEPTGKRPVPPAPAEVLAANAAQAQDAAAHIDGYIAAVERGLDDTEAVENLVLDIWLLGRERLLHALWLGEHPAAARAREHAAAWRRLAAHSYLAMRRARTDGRFAGTVLAEMSRQLHADADLARSLAPEPPPTPAGDVPPVGAVTVAVLDAVRHTLRLDEQTIRAAGTLRALPGFDSFRLVDIISRVEERLGVRLPGDLSGDKLSDIDGLCELFTAAATERAGRSGR
ncbi:acyl carrier protein [Actinomadura syzygii]|uniref:Acyl carrier protein n=1 Tax=Actinomadura syzygii TaxID=1427538 RepID=A0A5D0TWZ1_9ACTN|nr:acyl carrier protein [Actinomadura syzygii]TYC10347.1 acyl carrier protein [Actinomadura syzygii]